MGNFNVVDNEALGPNDFTQFSVTVPTTLATALTLPRQTISGLYDQNFVVSPRNVVKSASNFGAQYGHWNGIDLNVDARLQNGLLLQGGVSTGKTMSDNCAIVAAVPESLNVAVPTGVQAPIAAAGPLTAVLLPPGDALSTSVEGTASYLTPWWGIRVSGTFQSLPGPQIVGRTSTTIQTGRRPRH